MAIMRTRQRLGQSLAVAIAATFVPSAGASDWDWIVEPYIWASRLKTDVRTDSPPIAGSSEIEFKDILDKLDGSLQLHVEGRGDEHGMFVDITYLRIKDTRSGRFARTKADLETRLFEAAWVWTPAGRRDRGLDVFGGVRYLDSDLKLTIRPNNPAFNGRVLNFADSYLDVMLGGRYTWVPAERWRLTTRADSSFGETEGSWNVSAMVHYHTAHGALLLGYRHLEVKVKNDDARTRLTMTGPYVGYAFLF